MKIAANFVKPEAYEVQLVIAMTLGEWKEIASRLGAADTFWPCGKLAESIKDVVRKVELSVFPDTK